MENKELIIIGAGAAGLTAAIYAQRYGIQSTIIEKFYPGGLAATADLIENIPGVVEPVRGAMWMMDLLKQTERFGPEILSGVTVLSVEKSDDGFVVKTDGDTYLAGAVIIASGCSHRKLGVPGEEQFYGKGISYCATCDGMFFRDKNVAIIGGGNTALQGALVLANIVKELSIVHRRTEYRGEKANLDSLNKFDNVTHIQPYQVKEFLGHDKIEQIVLFHSETKEEKIVPIEGVFVLVGFEPHTEPFKGLVDCDEHGFIKVNQNKETNVEGLYAAGDVTDTPLRQIVTSAADGAIAAARAYNYLKSR